MNDNVKREAPGVVSTEPRGEALPEWLKRKQEQERKDKEAQEGKTV